MSVSIQLSFGCHRAYSRVVDLPDYNVNSMRQTVAIQRLPTEPIGSFALTLINLVVGSAIQIERVSTGAVVEYRTAGTATEVFTVDAYSPGNALNDLRIKVRKGTTAPKYKPFETLATAAVGSQSVYIAQIPDTIAA